jgi:hypothetical protein
MEKTTSRVHMHNGASQQLTEKRRGANQGRTGLNGPRPVGPGRPTQPLFVAVRDTLWPKRSSINCLCHRPLPQPSIHSSERCWQEGKEQGGRRRSSQVLELPRRWHRPCPRCHGWPCVVKPWWSSGAMPWIHQGICVTSLMFIFAYDIT